MSSEIIQADNNIANESELTKRKECLEKIPIRIRVTFKKHINMFRH